MKLFRGKQKLLNFDGDGFCDKDEVKKALFDVVGDQASIMTDEELYDYLIVRVAEFHLPQEPHRGHSVFHPDSYHQHIFRSHLLVHSSRLRPHLEH